MPDLSIPQADKPFLDWARAFHDIAAESPSRYGLAAPDVALIESVVAEYGSAYHVTLHEKTRNKVTIREKNNAKVAAMQVMRMFVRLIQPNNGISDADKIALGLHIRARTIRRRQVPPSSPVLYYIGSTPLSHTLAYRDTWTPDSMRKPDGAAGLQLFMAIGDEPEVDANKARWAGEFNRSPFAVLHEVENARKVVTYFARWIGHRNDVGPWSLPVSAVVPWVSGGAVSGEAGRSETKTLRRAA